MSFYQPIEKGVSMKIRLNGPTSPKGSSFADLKAGNVFQADYDGGQRTFIKANGQGCTALRLTNGEMVAFSPSHPVIKRKDFVLTKS